MTDMSVDQVLAQMRALAAQSRGETAPPETGAPGFGAMLERSIDAVNASQQAAGQLKTAFEQGTTEAGLAEVMVAAQKADLSFQTMVQVRNKLVEAYKDVMNMPI